MNNFSLSLIMTCFMLSLCGCASEFNLATGEEESLIYGTDKEVNIGDAVAQQVENQVELVTDIDINERAETILARIISVCDRKDIIYHIKIIDEDVMNAFSLPGGYVFLYKGLVDKMENDDQLAGVIAHEVAHITARHGVKRLQAAYGYTILQVGAIAAGSGEAAAGMNALFTTVLLSYSRQDEYQADKLAVRYLKRAGYDPKGMTESLKKLYEDQQKAPRRPMAYFRTHPYLVERMAIVNKEITGQLDFEGYLNVTGNEEVGF